MMVILFRMVEGLTFNCYRHYQTCQANNRLVLTRKVRSLASTKSQYWATLQIFFSTSRIFYSRATQYKANPFRSICSERFSLGKIAPTERVNSAKFGRLCQFFVDLCTNVVGLWNVSIINQTDDQSRSILWVHSSSFTDVGRASYKRGRNQSHRTRIAVKLKWWNSLSSLSNKRNKFLSTKTRSGLTQPELA